MKKILKILGITLLVLLALCLLGFILLQFSSVQTYLGKKASAYLSKELNSEVFIESIDIDLWDSVHLNGVSLLDPNGDTLIYVNDLNTSTFSFNNSAREVHFSSVNLDQPKFHLRKAKGDSINNLKFLIDYFKPETPSGEDWTLSFDEVKIREGSFGYSDHNAADSLEHSFNARHILANNINGDISNLNIIGDSISLVSNQLSFEEKSGILAHDVKSIISISPTGILLNESNISIDNSQINGDLQINTESYADYSHYISTVKHDFKIRDSKINIADLNSFNSNTDFKELEIITSGNFKGKINRLKGKDVILKFAEESGFEGDVSLNGLPNINKTFIDLDISDLHSSKSDIERIIIPAFVNTSISIPENLNKLGNFSFDGDFTGFINDFVTYGTLKTDIGNLISDIKFKEIDSPAKYAYTGDLTTLNFDLSELYSNPNLGKLNSNISVSGKGLTRDLAELNLEGNIGEMSFGKHHFSDLEIKGDLKDNFFSGKLVSHDPNADLSFTGDVDFRSELPLYSFTSDIHHLDLEKFVETGLALQRLKTKLNIEARGSNADNLEGEICFEDVFIESETGMIDLESIFIHSSLSPERIISLESDLADGELKGNFNLNNLLESVIQLASKFSPEITPESSDSAGAFTLRLDVNNLNQAKDFLNKEYYVSENTSLTYESSKFLKSLSLTSDSISYNNYLTESLEFSILDSGTFTSASISSVAWKMGDQFVIRNPILESEKKDSIYQSSFVWDNGIDLTSGDISFDYWIDSTNYNLIFNNGDIALGPTEWQVTEGGGVNSDGKVVSFSELGAFNGNEKIFMNGSLDKDENTELKIENLDISTANYFTPEGTAQVKGTLNGALDLKNLNGENATFSQFNFTDFSLDDIKIGDISSSGVWNADERAFNLIGKLSTQEREPLSFHGKFLPFNEENSLDFTIEAEELQLDFLSALVRSAVSEFGGSLSGEIDVKGTPSEPLLNGELLFHDAEVKIDYLNTSYVIKDGIGIRPDMFILENIEILDEEGNSGYLIGSVIHTNYKKWSYDLLVDIESEPFLCLNTDKTQNELFHGKAYGTGFINVFGYDDFLEIGANASTGKGTVISMPLGDDENVEFEDFVSFVSADTTFMSSGLQQLQSEFDLYIDLEIDVTEDAEFQMIFDQVTGDVMKGRGSGHLSLIVDNESDFNMYGSIAVVEGDYLFTLQNLINKEFEIKPGGTINWYGDPFMADINLETIYKLSAPLYDLLGSSEETQSYRKRIPVELVMNLDGKLLNPGISFDIDLPTSDEITRSRVNSIISTEQEKNRQAFSLLVLKKFLSSSDANTVGHSQLGIAENSTEFISSQLNNWLSQITDEVDIGLNYRPGDEISSQEIALALSTQLFSDKLLISGNLGITRGNEQNQNPSTLIGDVRIEYLLGKDGKIRLLVYNDTNSFDINTTTYETTSTQGVGLLYKEEFDTWDEFAEEFKSLLKRDSKE